MKQSNFILSFLIPEKHAHGSDMNVFIEPLMDDMVDMFDEGIRTYDTSKREWFQLKAAVLWTITDFPGLGYVSGCVTAGEAACPDWHLYTCRHRLGKGSEARNNTPSSTRLASSRRQKANTPFRHNKIVVMMHCLQD
jgi:hypothetical protein